MLDREHTVIWKLRQAYHLNEREAESLLNALYPGGVFPFEVWRQNYEKWGMAYGLDSGQAVPVFPSIPENVCPTRLYAIQLAAALVDSSRPNKISALEEGFEAVIRAVYDDAPFPLKEEKEALFRLLREDAEQFHRQKSPWNVWKLQHQFTVEYDFIHRMFPDTVIVNKAAAVRYLHSCGYPLRQEAKGLSSSIVEQILAAPESTDTSAASEPGAITIPAALWEGKKYEAVRDTLREAQYSEPVIAFVLHNWCSLKKTEIGKLLSPVGEQEDSANRRRANRLLAEAEALIIRKA